MEIEAILKSVLISLFVFPVSSLSKNDCFCKDTDLDIKVYFTCIQPFILFVSNNGIQAVGWRISQASDDKYAQSGINLTNWILITLRI